MKNVYLIIVFSIPVLIGFLVYYLISNEIKKRTKIRINELEQSEYNVEIKNKLEKESIKYTKIQNRFNSFFKVFNPIFSLFLIGMGILGMFFLYEYIFIKHNFSFSNRNHTSTLVSPLVFIWGIISLIELFKKIRQNK